MQRRSEIVDMLKLALPAIAVQVGMMLMGTVDTMMIGQVEHHQARSLAAVALGHTFLQTVTVSVMGILIALDPLISQAIGAKDLPAVARALQRGFVLAAIVSVPSVVCLLPAESVFRFFDQDPAVIPDAVRYVKANLIGIPAFFFFVVQRTTLQAMKKLTPTLITVIAANLVNASFNWLLIYGKWGCPELGVLGAGLSTSLGRVFMAATLLFVARKEILPHLFPWRRDAFSPSALYRVVKIGLPIGLQFLFELGIFSLTGLMIGAFDAAGNAAKASGTFLAAHMITLNLASNTFMVPLGISIAAAVRVGQAVGAQDRADAVHTAKIHMLTGVGAMAVLAIVMRVIPGPIASLYTSDADVIAEAAILIGIAAVFQIFDGMQVVCIGILRGLGDTKAALPINIFGFWVVGLPAALWLGFSAKVPYKGWRWGLGQGPAGLWWGLVLGLVVVAVLLFLRVRRQLTRPLRRLEGPVGSGGH